MSCAAGLLSLLRRGRWVPVRLTFMAPLPGIQDGILSRMLAQPASATTVTIASVPAVLVIIAILRR